MDLSQKGSRVRDVFEHVPERNSVKMIRWKTERFEIADFHWNLERLARIRSGLFGQFCALNFPTSPAKFLKQHTSAAADIQHAPRPAIGDRFHFSDSKCVQRIL